jgi:hypothetical protein
MNWLIIAALALPYFYLLLLVNLNRDDVKRIKKELVECQAKIMELENTLMSHTNRLNLKDIKCCNEYIRHLNDKMSTLINKEVKHEE